MTKVVSKNPWVPRAPETPPIESAVLNVKQTSQFLGCSERTTYALTHPRGPIPTVRFGTAEKCQPRYLRSDLLAFLQAHRQAATTESAEVESQEGGEL